MSELFDRLFIFEMANNHMGDVEHGIEIISLLTEIAKKYPFKFAVKFQYRNLDTFIHPDFKTRMDIKYVKRFTETKLKEEDFLRMKNFAEKNGFITMCTPFDEFSVSKVEEHGFDILKIASCSLTDWPLLERIGETSLPVIASTAGAGIEEIDKAVSFYKHRERELCLMHCVGAYPTEDECLELNQIPFFKERYSDIVIGYSTHERPDNLGSIKMAVAMGAQVFERHVGVPTEKYPINGYSSTPEQIDKWLDAALQAYKMCGVKGKRREISEKERSDLNGLKRGVFAKIDIKSEEELKDENIFYAIPCEEGQVLANDISKYSKFILRSDISCGERINTNDVEIVNMRGRILEIITQLNVLLKKSRIHLKNRLDLELSHHYGIDQFYKTGCSMINCINREYCKKIIMLLPGQENPMHSHKKKEETFHILYGDIELNLDGKILNFHAGELVVVERGVKHSFRSQAGAVFEEISTTHYKDDSYYDDKMIMENENRKTEMTFWADWLTGELDQC